MDNSIDSNATPTNVGSPSSQANTSGMIMAPTYATQMSESMSASGGAGSASAMTSSAIKDKRHFKKSMIFEYEKIESSGGGGVAGMHHHMHHNDDSQSSSSCASFGGSPLMSRPPQQQPQQPKLSLASRLDEIRPVKLDMSSTSMLTTSTVEVSPALLPSSSTLSSFNQQLNTLNTLKADSDGIYDSIFRLFRIFFIHDLLTIF